MADTASSTLARFRAFVAESRGLAFEDFESLHRWSVEDQPAFWGDLWRFEGIESPTPFAAVLENPVMPGARWFPGAAVNYTRHVLRHADAAERAGKPAIIAEDETGSVVTIGWPDLRRKVASLALEMRRLGVTEGDRVVAYLPNRPEAIIAFLATAAIGAVWSVCSPDMGTPAILDRFRQIEPTIFIATDGVRYAGKTIDRASTVDDIRAALPTIRHTFLVSSGLSQGTLTNTLSFTDAMSRRDEAVDRFEPRWVSFDHPLWIVYSSGTTGKPKALVHGHGGIIINAAATRLHNDLRPSYDATKPDERFHWFSSTGWMMWNSQVGGLLGGATICIYDGSPAGSKENPDWGILWRFAARHRVTFFGAGAPFYTACMKAGLDFAAVGDLSAIAVLGSTASPLPAAVQVGLSAALEGVGCNAWWFNSSGGTDICGAFCTANPELPPTPGKLQCRQLGAAVESWSEQGGSLIDAVGELVCVRPLPSMPLFLWGDADGGRYRSSYFDKYPGIWRHGDWLRIEADGTCEIFGRSDATINRGGHRMGTSEIYDAIERLDAIADSLAVDVRTRHGESRLMLFIVPAEGSRNDDLASLVASAIRTSLSPRFVPDRVVRVAEIPRTLSGKKQELPVKRLFEGARLQDVVDLSAMTNPAAMTAFETLAADYRLET